MPSDVWCIPISAGEALIYAPFHGITTLVNRAMADAVTQCLTDPAAPVPENADWIRKLRSPGDRPEKRSGAPDPLFLGLITTRGCMMQCAYCDFVTLRNHPAMSFDMIREAADGYAALLAGRDAAEWNMHFFGGEPFAAFREIVFAVNYARRKAKELGIPTHFEVTTNGYYSEEKCRWIAEYFDTVVLSLDGFPDVQNLHRPGPGGKESFSVVCRNADIFSRGSCSLIIRSCVSAENAGDLAEWAAYLTDRWAPEAVCFEPMIESPQARKNGLHPPDPVIFAENWAAAAKVLKTQRIPLVYSSGEINSVKNSLCPMGRDALIITPDGRIGGCWQLAENQHAGGIDLRFGSVSPDGLAIDMDLLEQQRTLSESNRENCRGCFCYAHCAGGCVLNRRNNGDFCRMTRMLTLWQLLDRLGYSLKGDALLKNTSFTDRLSETDDFRPGKAPFPDHISLFADAQETEQHFRQTPQGTPPVPLLSDARRGWIRDGERILLADPENEKLSILEGDNALRFQLRHTGMSEADAAAVLTALKGNG